MVLLARKIFRFRADHIIALCLFAGLLLCVVGAQWIAPYAPYAISMGDKFLPPSSAHLLGTDDYGRDIFSRILYGARYSLAMGLVVALSSSIIGIVLGLAAGYLEGRTEQIIMRACDLFLGFPPLLLAMAIAAVLGSSLVHTIAAAAAVWWPSYVRLVRSQVLALKHEAYVDAAKALGASPLHVVLRHLLPNCWAPLNVRMTMDLGRAVLFTGALSFIGLGAQPPLPEWGSMLAEARVDILTAWWYPTFPGLAIFCAVLCFSLLGDILDGILRPD